MRSEILKRYLLVGGICFASCSSAWAYTLMAPLWGPPWPAEHDWTIHGCGLRGYAGGYTHLVAGGHDYMLHVPFLAVAAAALAIVGVLSGLGMAAIRGLSDGRNGD